MPLSNASRLADFGTGIGTQGAIIQVDNTNQRLGVGTTAPTATLGVAGIVSSSSFWGDGITVGVATVNTAVYVGTALTTNAAGDVETIGIITAASFSGSGANLTSLPVGTTITVADESSDTTCFPSFFTAATGNLAPKTGSNLTFNSSSGALTATSVNGNIVGGTVAGSTGTFSGAVNVNDTTDSTSTSTGSLIVDGGLGVAKNVYIGAGLSVAGTLTYEDVTSVDSVGLITAKSGVNVSGGQLIVGSGITMGIAGVATFSGTADIHLLDNVQLNVGDGSDLVIKHDGSHSYVQDSGTGNLYLRTNGAGVVIDDGSATFARFLNGDACDFNFNGSKKFETTNDGTVTTGIATAAGLRSSGSATVAYIETRSNSTQSTDSNKALRVRNNSDTDTFNVSYRGGVNISGGSDINIAGSAVGVTSAYWDASANNFTLKDNTKIRFGDGQDLEIYHSGGDSFIKDVGTGGLYLCASQFLVRNAAADEIQIQAVENAAVSLYYNNSQKFETTNDGTVTTGISTVTGVIDAQGYINLAQKIVHTGDTDTSIEFDTNIIKFETAGTERLNIAADGHVRVGSGDPTYELELIGSGSQHLLVGSTDASGATLILDGDSNGDGSGSDYATILHDTSGNLVYSNRKAASHIFKCSSSEDERLRITSKGEFLFSNGTLVERCKITAGKLSDNTNLNLADGMVFYFTTEETTTCTPNIRVDGSTTLNSKMSAGDVVTVTVITTADASGYSANWTIDGNAVTEQWVGGSAPSAGGSDGLDIYVLTIICIHDTNTGDSGFEVIANLTNAT